MPIENKSISVINTNVNNLEDVNNVYPILRLKSQNTNENSSINIKETKDKMGSVMNLPGGMKLPF